MRIFYSKCKFSQLVFSLSFSESTLSCIRVYQTRREANWPFAKEKNGEGVNLDDPRFFREREREISFLAKQPSLSLFLSLSNHLVVKSNNNLLERIELLLFPRKIERDGRNDFSNFIFHFVKFVKFAFANVSFLFNRKTLRGGIEII